MTRPHDILEHWTQRLRLVNEDHTGWVYRGKPEVEEQSELEAAGFEVQCTFGPEEFRDWITDCDWDGGYRDEYDGSVHCVCCRYQGWFTIVTNSESE